MKISGVLIRFVIVYLLLAALVTAVLHWMDIKNNVSAEFSILIGSVLWASAAFHAKNGRYFTPGERIRIVLGMILIDLTIQALIFGAWLFEKDSMSIRSFFFGLMFAAPLHAVVIYFATGWLAFRRRNQLKQEEPRPDGEAR